MNLINPKHNLVNDITNQSIFLNKNINIDEYKPLVSKNIDIYFNELILKPDPVKNVYTFSNFYDEYIEHNILLLFIIACLVVFFIIKYYNKYTEEYINIDPVNVNKCNTIKKKIKKNISKTNLELEKKSILDIIDELSSLNYVKIKQNNELIEKEYNNIHSLEIPKYIEEDVELNNNYTETLLFNNNIDSNDYYNINKNIDYNNKNDKNNIKGIYIDSPYAE